MSSILEAELAKMMPVMPTGGKKRKRRKIKSKTSLKIKGMRRSKKSRE